ncbi:GNAT family N-acetyltransferase [Halobacillus sp. BBL2006]|uniref:GNAT family N-acetyltransferase n=1 Tax=Halobacillus sp. BBL2006 TaxID=1543706 RepID=UPI0005437F9D|nr:GNAT family N-acetyltransferase [Halobacillus sp. BBL2006]KHE70569.1 acetyltransferase [Halobacillus sp. BBL2006]
MEIKPIDAEETISLRHQILRSNQPREACQYPKDGEANSFHLGAFHGDTLISIASFYHEKTEKLETEHQYRLRGMATLLEWRGMGAGTLLIKEAEAILKKRNAKVLWCNARTSARGYYDRLHFHQVGEVFDLPPIGPHVVLYKEIEKH